MRLPMLIAQIQDAILQQLATTRRMDPKTREGLVHQALREPVKAAKGARGWENTALVVAIDEG
jgi:hypothetical protein